MMKVEQFVMACGVEQDGRSCRMALRPCARCCASMPR